MSRQVGVIYRYRTRHEVCIFAYSTCTVLVLLEGKISLKLKVYDGTSTSSDLFRYARELELQ